MNNSVKQFLLSLVNATLVLVVIAAGFVIFAIYKAQSFANSVLSDVKIELLKEVDKEVVGISGSIRKTDRDFKFIGQRLDRVLEHPTSLLAPDDRREIRSLTTELKALRSDVQKLTTSQQVLSDQAIREIAATMAQTVIDVRRCGRQ